MEVSLTFGVLFGEQLFFDVLDVPVVLVESADGPLQVFRPLVLAVPGVDFMNYFRPYFIQTKIEKLYSNLTGFLCTYCLQNK
jgi:hypothetical protein